MIIVMMGNLNEILKPLEVNLLLLRAELRPSVLHNYIAYCTRKVF
jgi:hypothetical protein